MNQSKNVMSITHILYYCVTNPEPFKTVMLLCICFLPTLMAHTHMSVICLPQTHNLIFHTMLLLLWIILVKIWSHDSHTCQYIAIFQTLVQKVLLLCNVLISGWFMWCYYLLAWTLSMKCTMNSLYVTTPLNCFCLRLK